MPRRYDGLQGHRLRYSCRNVFDDNIGYPVGLRIGFESVGDDGADDSGEDIAKGFGLVHAEEDHNIGPHSIALIVADTPPEENGKHPARWNYPMALLFNGNIEEVLTVVVQKAPDEMKRTPDGMTSASSRRSAASEPSSPATAATARRTFPRRSTAEP